VDSAAVVTALLQAGVSEHELRLAEESGMLLALLADRFLLPGERRYDLAGLAERTGVTPEVARRLWRSMGLADPRPGDRVLRDEDAEFMLLLTRGAHEVTDYLVHEARVINSALARIAEVLVDEIWEQHVERSTDQHQAAAELASDFDLVRLEQLLLGALRRQMVAAVSRRCALSAVDRSHFPTQAVGFADLVGFTALSDGLEESDLAERVGLFETACHDVLSVRDVRLVKMLGDEVMFASPHAERTARAGLQLIDTVDGIAELPPIRGGLVAGPVIARDGDYYGRVVNLAKRITGVAPEGAVCTDDRTRRLLGTVADFRFVPLGTKWLKGAGSHQLWRTHRLSP
jgi:adenylate cyclase